MVILKDIELFLRDMKQIMDLNQHIIIQEAEVVKCGIIEVTIM